MTTRAHPTACCQTRPPSLATLTVSRSPLTLSLHKKTFVGKLTSGRARLGNGGAGPGGVTAEANARVMAVLEQIGLEGASQLPNGSIRLPDGRIVGSLGLDGEGSGGDASNSSAGGGGSRAGGAYTSTILRSVPSNVRVMVQGLEGEVRGVKKKLKVWWVDVGGFHSGLGCVTLRVLEDLGTKRSPLKMTVFVAWFRQGL